MTFLTIGHRGVMGVEPENTLRSFIRAERSGMDVIALDVRLSKDGALVVLHDAEVDRTTDGAGAVADLTLAELRELDAGLGEHVPVFEEALDAVRAPLQVSVRDQAAAVVLAELVLRLDATARVEVASFHDEVLAEVTRRVPGIKTTLYADQSGAGAGEVVDRAVAVRADTVALNIRRLTLEAVEAAHSAGLRVTGWTVNTLEQLRLVRALELDGAVTDFPEIRSTGRFTA
ncbi:MULTISPECIES: glycerophosphodiester phosphodiesterase family protein [unclassified Streptomyces]|uniref:glycerophosphodiester phosphodiesterase n=1 Tax=unclassified Streptomyces TaxID=2593676 RepID=UPI001BE93ADA|nr:MULTISPECIES: glycerophosphodiester phosphodiesterase family protein [unclassified Streptomyces]MBT2407779.1 glycerophosphodiester phosphodiesterase [Streptomyces sp. ISL-21]MBT2613784.1 glycerophosphodiester phosphodiesterase [Streptomyces sp. ISL-87]